MMFGESQLFWYKIVFMAELLLSESMFVCRLKRRRLFVLRLAAALTALTPGDFAVVKNKAEILGVSQQTPELLKLLEAEQTAKSRYASAKIGFCK